MNEIKKEETQQDFFPEFSKESRVSDRFPSLPKTQKPLLINTSLEQLLLVGIICILAACSIFFLGVLRGRALDSMSPRETATQPVKKVLTPNIAASAAQPAQVIATPTTQPMPQVVVATQAAKPYTIQLVTYKKRSLAEKEVSDLRRNGYAASIIPSGEYYIVCGGQYSSIEESKKDLKYFASRYKGCFLRRR